MDPRMMRQWLAAQGQKKQLSEADMQRKRLGIVPNAEVRNKAGESATRASTPHHIAGEIDRTRIRMPRGSILDARSIGQMNPEQIQEAMMAGYCATVSKKKI